MAAINLVSPYRNLFPIFKGFPQHNPNPNPTFPHIDKNPRYLWFSISLSISKRLGTVEGKKKILQSYSKVQEFVIHSSTHMCAFYRTYKVFFCEKTSFSKGSPF